MIVNGYSTLSKAPGQEPHYQMQFSILSRKLVERRESYPSTEMQSAYFTVPSDWNDRHKQTEINRYEQK